MRIFNASPLQSLGEDLAFPWDTRKYTYAERDQGDEDDGVAKRFVRIYEVGREVFPTELLITHDMLKSLF